MLLKPAVEEFDYGGYMKVLRTAGVAALLLLAIPSAADAQDEEPNDRAMQIIARHEAKHFRSRQNLTRILRDQPDFWTELQAIAKRLKTEPAWLLNVMASESLFDPTARNGLPGQTATGLLQFIEKTARHRSKSRVLIKKSVHNWLIFSSLDFTSLKSS